MKKILSIFLAAVMIFSFMSIIGFAKEAQENNSLPVIFVDGIASSAIINTETGESQFPPSASAILAAVGDLAEPLAKAIDNRDLSSIGVPVSKALVKMFDGVACDVNGDPIYPTDSEYKIPTAEDFESGEVYEALDGFSYGEAIKFSYDWRLDVITIASQLHDCIEAVLENTGAEKVNLVGFSMGTCIVTTYLHDYNYEYVNDVAMLSGAYNGVACCGEPFSGQVDFDEKGLVAFLKTVLGPDITTSLVKVFVDILYNAGIVTGITDYLDVLSEQILDDLFENGLQKTFARFPGMWALVPYDMYDSAKELALDPKTTDEFLAKIDYYHNEIQVNNKAILDGVMERGGNLAVISKYGSTIPPVSVSQKNIGDLVLDVVNTSFGATCATADTTLGADYLQTVECGHNHISSDKMIDASTCAYPEYTWFIKGMFHANHTEGMWDLIRFIFASETQPTVWDSEAYPQFLISLGNNELVPLTVENDIYKYEEIPEVEESFFKKIINIIKVFFKSFIDFFKSMF